MRCGVALAYAVMLTACAGTPERTASPANREKASTPTTAVAPSTTPTTPTPATPTAHDAPHEVAPVAPAAATPQPCGEFGCMLYDSPRDALAAVLADDPLVLAVGEMHALAGTEHVASATRHFTEDFLPLLAGRATDLVLELWVADPDCKRAVAKVEKSQRQITTGQAPSNQNEYVTLGNESKRLGIQPHVLEPSCDDYDRIAKAGDDDVIVMLETIAKLTAKDVAALVERNRTNAPGKLVATYGGAIHNDIDPAQGAHSFSFGPTLAERAPGRYIALDLVVPELIRDTRLWRTQPWRAQYDPEAHPGKTTLFHPRPGEYALIFPRATPAR